MPGGLRIAVDRDYDTFIADLSARFPHEANRSTGASPVTLDGQAS